MKVGQAVRYGNRRLAACLLTLTSLLVSTSALPCLASEGESRLKGHVQSSDHVRLQRPKTPVLESASASTAPAKHDLKAFVDFGDADFAKQMAREMPETDSTASGGAPPVLEDAVEDKDLVIAWEEWYRRVTKELYENWIRNSVSLRILGQAHATITVTRDRHISVSVAEIDIDPYQLPSNAGGLEEKLRSDFEQAVRHSVEPLDGRMVLDFPEKSRRTQCTWRPYFQATEGTRSFYEWRKNDYERVPLN